MNNYKSVFLFMLLSITACDLSPQSPLQVAEAFWQATLKGDIHKAKQFMTPDSREDLEITLHTEHDRVEFGEIQIQNNSAEIKTFIHAQKNNQAVSYRLNTILVNQNNQWKVDYTATRRSMLGSELEDAFEDLTEKLQETFNDGMIQMGESLKQGIEEFERELDKSLRELEKDLEQQLPREQPYPQPQPNRSNPPI